MQTVQKRPDYRPVVLTLTEPMRLELIKARKQLSKERSQAEKKQPWFERKYGNGQGCAKTAKVVTLSQGDKLAEQIA